MLVEMDVALPTRNRAWVYRRAMSLPEVLLWKAIKGRRLGGLHFRRQHPIGRYVLDFYCHAARLAVEVDGQSHGLGDRPQRDERRDAWMLANGIRTLRIPASVVLDDVDAATGWILTTVEETPSPSALRAAGPPPKGRT
jgi:very-short-patch-repair endonuclease